MAKSEDLKKIEKKNQEVSKYDFIICPNCGETEVGRFCPSCGQSNKDFNKPIKEIVGDILDSINLDIRLLKTLIPFFTKPGFLTQEYFNGRRKKYVPPMRMYMFFSILFFFLVQYIDNNEIKNNMISFNNGTSEKKLTFSNDNNRLNDSLFVENLNVEEDDIDSTKEDNIISINGYSGSDMEKLKQEVLNDSTNSDPIKQTIIGAINASKKKELFFDKFLKNTSYMLFFLMPFFAVILALILWKSRMLYVKHLIFSINFHSFIFGLSSFIIILGLILPEKFSGFEKYLFWGVPIYLIIGIKHFYSRRYIGAFFKSLGALALYTIILSIVVIAILAITAKGFYEI